MTLPFPWLSSFPSFPSFPSFASFPVEVVLGY
jgi:hypothetical protein